MTSKTQKAHKQALERRQREVVEYEQRTDHKQFMKDVKFVGRFGFIMVTHEIVGGELLVQKTESASLCTGFMRYKDYALGYDYVLSIREACEVCRKIIREQRNRKLHRPTGAQIRQQLIDAGLLRPAEGV